MSYRDCLACKDAGTKPKRGKGKRLVFDPGITMPGQPTIENRRLGAEFIAERVHDFGIRQEEIEYELGREELLVACWWAGLYGSRKLKKLFGEWARVADRHLWYRCIQIPDPPQQDTRLAP